MVSAFSFRLAHHQLRSSGIISYKTDTLIGLSCDPYNQQAINRINQIKQRPVKKTFILLASQFEQLLPLIHPSACRHRQTIINTTEPTSWILPASKTTPYWLKAKDNTIAVRISSDPVTKILCTLLASPIISSSANISGRPAAKNLFQLRKTFGRQIDRIIQSSHEATGKPSRMLRLCDNKLIRP